MLYIIIHKKGPQLRKDVKEDPERLNYDDLKKKKFTKHHQMLTRLKLSLINLNTYQLKSVL